MELTKEDNLIAKGIGIIGMVLLHLFCRQGVLPYCPMIWVGDTPLVYYIGLLGDMCVPIIIFFIFFRTIYVVRKKINSI